MTSDYRITSDFIHDILDALERHGYTRSDDLHAGRAIGLIGDLAHIYEGTQDAPPSGYVVVPSSKPTAPQSPGPRGQDSVLVSADQLKTLLAALDDAAEYKRDRAETCADCAGQSCTTCQWRLQAAEAYDQLAGHMIHAAATSATRQRAPGHTSPPSAGPHAAADPEAGQ
jgi:ferredoxin